MATAAPPKYFTQKSQVPLGANESLYFTAGKGYHAGPKIAPHVAHAAPTAAQLAQQQVDATFSPIVKQTTDAFNQRGTAQQSAIDSYSSELANLMGSYGPTSKDAYSGAITGQAAIDAALAATRQGQGADAQAQLAANLAKIDADPGTAARITSQFGTDTAGAAQAAAARGATGLASLLGQSAHAQDYADKLPAVAGSMGLRATEQAQGQITNDLATALGNLKAQEPGAFQTALNNILSRRATAAKTAFDERFKVGQANEHIDEFNARQTLAGESLQLRERQYKIANDFAQQRITLTEQKQSAAVEKALTQGRDPDAALSKIYRYVVDSHGNPILDAAGQKIPVKTSTSKSSTLPPWATPGKSEPAGVNAPKVYGPVAAGGFLMPGSALKIGRVDQGRDLQVTPGAPIVAPGAGVVVRIASDPGGGGAHFGPSYPIVHFTSGPYAGQTLYIGHTVSALRPGQQFGAGDVLSHTQRSGPLNGGAPDGWVEIGFAPGNTPGPFGQKPPF